jgi:hypothetical protein
MYLFNIVSQFIIFYNLCSSEFKSFAYLYNEDQFMAALAKDVNIVKTLPKNLKWARRKKEIPSFKVRHSASPYYYLNQVLLVLKKHAVVELVVSEGGCLQVVTVIFCPFCFPSLTHSLELNLTFTLLVIAVQSIVF